MVPFRDELDAAHERIEHLEQELAEARRENEPPPPAPKAPSPGPPRRGSRLRAVRRLAIVAALGVGAVYAYPHVFSGEWEGVHRAILVDVNGDGVLDIVGRIRHMSSDRVTIAAADGRTGGRLWESEGLGSYMETYQGALGLAGDRLLYAAPGGELRAYGARDGKNRWSGRLAEKVKQFCTGDRPGEVKVKLANDTIVSLSLADGSSVASADHGGACDALADDDRGSADWKGGAGGTDSSTTESSSAEGRRVLEAMSVSYTLSRPGGPRVFFGTRKKGTSVPMIGAIYDEPSRSWSRDMPGGDPLQTSPEPFVHGTISSTDAFATYQRGSNDPHVVVCIDLTGKRRWEATLPNTQPLTSIQAEGDRVLLSQWGRLTVYDASTGKVRFSIGG